MRAAGELAVAPADFAGRAHRLFSALGTTSETLAAALDDADRLVAEVCGHLDR